MDFPENRLGLTRGTMLEVASEEAAQKYTLSVGDRIPIGFDGWHIKCQRLTWDVDELIREIAELGYWNIVGALKLTDPKRLATYRRSIERCYRADVEC